MPAAVAIPLISGAMGIGGAAISAHAAGSAADKQTAAGQKGLDLQKQIYDSQKSMLAPYVSGGASAFQNLMNGYWQNQNYGNFANGRQPYSPYSATSSQPGGGSGFGAAFMPAQPRPPLSVGGMQQPQGAPGAAPGGGGMVTVSDDTGMTRQVPVGQASAYRSRGFKVMA